MYKNKNRITKLVILLIVFATCLLLTGCKEKKITIEELTNNKVLVVYNGNGGFLGNKTAQVRKLYADVGSVIPAYETDYTGNPYVVTGLGLAMKDGYSLNGWYIDDEEHVEYVLDTTGHAGYIKLEGDNGLYNPDKNGKYVFKYIEDVEGKYVFFSVEQPIDETQSVATSSYVFVKGEEDKDGEFKIYDPDNTDHIASKELYGEIAGSILNVYAGYTKLETIEEENIKNLFNGSTKFTPGYFEFAEGDDEESQRYSYGEGYAKLDVMLEEDNEGKYIVKGEAYELYDSANPDHQNVKRYNINCRYVFNDNTKTPTEYDRYNANIKYWDFTKDRITEEMKEEGGITLYADWTKKLTVYFVYEDVNKVYEETMTIDEYAKDSEGNPRTFNLLVSLTTKMNASQTASINLSAGDTLTKPGQKAAYEGYTFLNWSKSPDENIPWNFETDVIPEGVNTLYLYAYMIKGSYTIIETAEDLAKIGNNLSGNYLLAKSIDLGGEVYTNKTPAGISISASKEKNSVFTGEFKSLTGNETISNFSMKISNVVKSIDSANVKELAIGLFPYTFGANIEGIKLTNVNVQITNSTAAVNIIGDMDAAVIVGKALSLSEYNNEDLYNKGIEYSSEKKTTIKDCSVNAEFAPTASKELSISVIVGDVVAAGAANCTITNCTSTYDVSKLSVIGSYTTNFLGTN